MQPLRTSRLILRSFAEADIESFAAYRSDPAVARYQGWEIPFTTDEAAAMAHSMRDVACPPPPGCWLQIAIENASTATHIGDCALQTAADDPRQAMIGFTLATAHQHNGYAREAVTRLLDHLFTDHRMHRVIAMCDVENHPSCRLLERIGMRREAHHIQNLWTKRRWASEYVYAILGSEWSTAQSRPA